MQLEPSKTDFIKSLATAKLTPSELLMLLPKKPEPVQLKYWYRVNGMYEVDTDDWQTTARYLGFRKRSSYVFRFVEDSRIAIQVTRRQYFDAMRRLVDPEDPDADDIYQAIDYIMEFFGWQMVYRLENLPKFYNPQFSKY
ncbi:MAG TPA: hypothetical protein VGM30_14930 [Puia sp.]|jgi:hypothetical protein